MVNCTINSLETKEKQNEKVEIIADISSEEKVEDEIEHIITRFTMEPGVFYIGYKKQKDNTLDDDDES